MSADEVKGELDAQSGRFEFLKQALTLGLAGLAGIAAVFTDAAKVPTHVGTAIAALVIGGALLCLVGTTLMGLSVYANLLKAAAESAQASNDPQVTSFRSSLINHARWVFGFISLTAAGFVAFAVLSVLLPAAPKISSIEAIGLARKALIASGCEARLDAVSRDSSAFHVSFLSANCGRRYTVTVAKEDGSITVAAGA